ncbi:uncharacterized protein LOC127265362 [Andrographis paniculata]|uniref:uncharacterized protein LOC127265362 n=1 Tax=Andrographis paniculata TaxID=175694 RepID=UPI0021E946F6|nr:uncharacterized protein LOC127265362 [Andrographis paniculata]XP_051151087.1 uncharacterized protein LOC127265362 [Andrographis paniculata]XP_051151088.1 uncharacterized protein LOC127265362 [Andrographis paniculata]XP_051151089.1 uncharacterized protein LOC127265362 [Andrographis paniculata]
MRDTGKVLRSQKVQEGLQFSGLNKPDAYHEVLQSRETRSQISEFRRQLEMEQVVACDADFKEFLLGILNCYERVAPDKKRKENGSADEHNADCDGEEKNDPQYERFLENLTEHGKSYALKYENNGSLVFIKYEERDSFEECDSEPRRKLRSAMKQGVECSQMSCGENQRKRDHLPLETNKLTGRISRDSVTIIDVDDDESTGSDYRSSHQTAKAVDKGNAGLYKSYNLPLRARLRSSMKQKIGSSNDGPASENPQPANKTEKRGRKLRSEVMSEQCNEKNIKCMTKELVPVSDYRRTRLRSGMRQKIGSFDGKADSENRSKDDFETKNKTENITGRTSGKKGMSRRVQNKYTSKEMVPNPEDQMSRLRSGMKKNVEFSNSMSNPENDWKPDSQSTEKTESLAGGRKSRKKAMSARAHNVHRMAEEVVPDPDYFDFLQSTEVINDSTDAGRTGEHENNDGVQNQTKENYDDDSSDMEIIDSASFHNALDNSIRQELMEVLNRPYNTEELESLWHNVKQRKPLERHLDLRNGREKSCSKRIDGRSYLDQHPDVKKKLSQCEDDKPACLNILRGFFFWLKNAPHNPSFKPWLDAECLSIKPESASLTPPFMELMKLELVDKF